MNFTKVTNDLFEKYNINPNAVNISDITCMEDKKFLLYYLLKAHELAEKNSLKGNLTASSYACLIVLDDNSVHFGVNFNDTRCEISSICAERMALLDAFNYKVQHFDPENPNFKYKIKYILMTSYTEKGKFWSDKITPCADCLSWFNACKNLTFDTKICFLKKEKESFLLDISPLDKFLPLRNLSYKVSDGENLPIVKSAAAKEVNLSEKEIVNLYKKSYAAYKNNPLARTSGQNIGAGVIANGEIFTGVKIDFSKRWFIEPLMAACYKAIEKYGLKTDIQAICVVGEEYTTTENHQRIKDGIISLKTIGRLNTRFAHNKTLVVTGGAQSLQVYTIGDYLPSEHKFIHNYEIK